MTVFLISSAVYLNSLRNDFNLDDNAIIKENPIVRSLSNLPKIFVSNYWANTPYEKGVLLYRPLVIASFAFDHALWANNPFGFHLANVLLNGLNGVLALWLLTLLFGGKVNGQSGGNWKQSYSYGASRRGEGTVACGTSQFQLLVAALVFSLHPVHTEAVNMVVGRTELMAALFGLLTFLFHLKHRTWLSVVSFFLALLCKESAITIPLMIFTYEWLSKPVSGRKNKKIYFSYAAIFIIYFVLRWIVLGGLVAAHQTGILDRLSVLQRGLAVIKVLGYYLKLLFVPYPLSPDYSDVPWPKSFSDILVLLPVLVIAALLYFAWRLRDNWPAIAFAIIWFFVTLLPVSNIISIGAFLGERFMYLPSLSLGLLTAATFYYCQPKNHQRAFLAVWTVVLAVFGCLTFERNYDWRNAHALWTDVLEHQPENPRANFHLAEKFAEEKDYEKASALYQKSITFYPDHNWNPDSKTTEMVKDRLSEICYHLALAAYKQGQFEDALVQSRKAIDYDDKNAPAYVIAGNVFVQQDNFKQAAKYYEAALKADPNQFEARENLKRIEQFK